MQSTCNRRRASDLCTFPAALFENRNHIKEKRGRGGIEYCTDMHMHLCMPSVMLMDSVVASTPSIDRTAVVVVPAMGKKAKATLRVRSWCGRVLTM